jgi:hypothetical protein
MLNHLVRLPLMTAMAAGFSMPERSVDVAEAACKACKSGKCQDVDGGAHLCVEFSDGTCQVNGGLCNS